MSVTAAPAASIPKVIPAAFSACLNGDTPSALEVPVTALPIPAVRAVKGSVKAANTFPPTLSAMSATVASAFIPSYLLESKIFLTLSAF